MSERDEGRHVATGDAAPAAPAVGVEEVEEVEASDPVGDDVDVLQAVVDFIGDLVESEVGNGDVPPEALDT